MIGMKLSSSSLLSDSFEQLVILHITDGDIVVENSEIYDTGNPNAHIDSMFFLYMFFSCLLQSHFLVNNFTQDLHSNFDEYWCMFNS